MKDRFKDLEVEMTLEDKFKLVCSAIGARPSEVISNNISKRISTQRLFVANFLSEYIRHGLPELMQKSPVTVYGMINKINIRRMKQDADILRLDRMMARHVDMWLKPNRKRTKYNQHEISRTKRI